MLVLYEKREVTQNIGARRLNRNGNKERLSYKNNGMFSLCFLILSFIIKNNKNMIDIFLDELKFNIVFIL